MKTPSHNLRLPLAPRWKKVFFDIWENKTRTFLVVISIAVGVFALGMIATSRIALSQGLKEEYTAINPSSAMIMVSDPFFGIGEVGFGDDLVEAVRNMPDIGEAEGRRKVMVRIQVGPDSWRDFQLFAIPDYDDIRINKVKPQSGDWPPGPHDVLIERSALTLTGADVGDTITIKTPSNRLRQMRITGITHDLSQMPSFLDGAIYGYITFDTLEWLGVSREYNELHIVVARDKYNKEHIQQVAEAVKDKVERSGRPVYYVQIYEPGEHPLDNIIQGIVFLLGVLGVLSLFLSGFLVITTISAIMAQQVRQIGILKTIGGQRWQIMTMYFALALAFGLLALLLAVPFGAVGANAFANFMASLFNFDLSEFRVPPQVVAMQVVVSLLVPLLAALVPILQGTAITVREALDSQSGKSSYGKSIVDRLIRRVHGLSRPLLLSLRNTFRRKGRLALTLATLTLSGTMFITVFNVRDSLFQTLDDLMAMWNYDIWINLNRPHSIDELEREAMRVHGVVEAKGIGFVTTRRERTDGTDSDILFLFAPPAGSTMIRPVMLKGRWLLPDDENAIVLSTQFIKEESDIDIGSTITLSIDGKDTVWTVVGINQFLAPFAYVNYDHFARAKGEVGRATSVWVITEHHDLRSQTRYASVIEQLYEERGVRVSSVVRIAEEQSETALTFNIIVVMLAAMAVLLAVVGGLGLMGTMSINVLERTREIGIMRAIGASTVTIIQMVIAEGVMIGVASWMLSAGLAFVLSKPLGEAAGIAMFQFPLTAAFSLTGLLLWLLVVVVLSALASFLPAWNASRLTVQAVLAYE